MNDQLPIKRHQAIVSFSKDHHFGLLLVWKIRHGLDNSINAARISNYVKYFFEEDLEKHFKEEEQLLFSRLPVYDSLRKRAEEDHQVIYKLVKAIDENKSDKKLLIQLANELEKHIRFEERELFNNLQNTITAEDLELIEKRFPDNGKTTDESWEDIFWEIKK